MPIYDMFCTSCYHPELNVMYKSFEAFENADKSCPCCKGGKLERAAVQHFNAGKKVSQTYTTESGHIIHESTSPVLLACRKGDDVELSLGLLSKIEGKKDPGMN